VIGNHYRASAERPKIAPVEDKKQMRSLTVLVSLVAASAFATACGYEHNSSGLVPSGPGTPAAANTPVTTPLVGTWVSAQSVTFPSPSSCGNFQWEVTRQTTTSIAGNFSTVCAGNLTISGTAAGQLIGDRVPITATGTASLPGIPSCSFSVSGTGTIVNPDTLTIPYEGTTCLGPVHGTETLRRHTDPPPAPAPAPAPTPVPTPPPGPTSNDAINLGQATIRNSPSDVASWPATARITLLDLGTGGAHIDFTKRDGPGSWPDVAFMTPGENLQYTLWIVLNINGRWYASGCIQFWRGLDRSGGPPSQYAQNWYYDPSRWAPMTGHQPQPGEQVGFFVTAGDARNNGRAIVHERSNVVVVPFPGDGGGTFGF
jgi:hypothetical protein